MSNDNRRTPSDYWLSTAPPAGPQPEPSEPRYPKDLKDWNLEQLLVELSINAYGNTVHTVADVVYEIQRRFRELETQVREIEVKV